jgi:hypothetical protein
MLLTQLVEVLQPREKQLASNRSRYGRAIEGGVLWRRARLVPFPTIQVRFCPNGIGGAAIPLSTHRPSTGTTTDREMSRRYGKEERSPGIMLNEMLVIE